MSKTCITLFALVLIPFLSAKAESPKKIGLYKNEGRLACYQYIELKSLNTVTRSSYTSFKQMPTSAKDYVHKLFKSGENQYLVIPSERLGKNGFYLITDVSSAWIPLPPEKPNHEMVTIRGEQKYATDCFHFSDKENVGGGLFIIYGNYSSWTNPGTIQREKPRDETCVNTAFTTVNDDQMERAFTDDLIKKIQDVPRVSQNTRRISVERQNRGDISYKELPTASDDAESLQNCINLLDQTRDAKIIAAAAQARAEVLKTQPSGKPAPSPAGAE
jgi:hypothetical protein